jgi:hypothetical protein
MIFKLWINVQNLKCFNYRLLQHLKLLFCKVFKFYKKKKPNLLLGYFPEWPTRKTPSVCPTPLEVGWLGGWLYPSPPEFKP